MSKKGIYLSSWAKITILSSLIVFCFVFGFYTGTRSEQDNLIKNKVVEISQPTDADKITEWKEYKNDELGISFMYPSSCGELKTKYEYPDTTTLVFSGYFVNGIDEIVKDYSNGVNCSFAGFGTATLGFSAKNKNFKNLEGVNGFIVENTIRKYGADRYNTSHNCGTFCSDYLGYTEVIFKLKSSKFDNVKFSGKFSQQFMSIIDSIKIY